MEVRDKVHGSGTSARFFVRGSETLRLDIAAPFILDPECFRASCARGEFPPEVAIDVPSLSNSPHCLKALFGSLAHHSRLARLEVSPVTHAGPLVEYFLRERGNVHDAAPLEDITLAWTVFVGRSEEDMKRLTLAVDHMRTHLVDYQERNGTTFRKLELQGVWRAERWWNRRWYTYKRANPELLRELLGARLQLLEEAVGEVIFV